MNKSKHQLQATLAECLLTELSGLSEKHTKKLQKTIAKATKKLVRKYAKLEAKGPQNGKKAKPVAALPASKKVALRAAKAAPRSALAKQPGAAARGAQKKAAPAR